MKKLCHYLVLMSFALAGPLAVADTSAKLKVHQQKVSLLFVMRASEAIVTKTDKGLVITLKGTDAKTLYFSDRPVRKAGLMPTEKFMGSWIKKGSSFQKNPPNVAIVFPSAKTQQNGIDRATSVELKNPALIDTNTWSFTMTDLEGKLVVGSYNEVSIFVDAGAACATIPGCESGGAGSTTLVPGPSGLYQWGDFGG